ncbi:MAG: hypothetical protein IBX56_09210 [Methylomicrobium sp.]|nr:hypothetical protein [Methylomicrobium sp.]
MTETATEANIKTSATEPAKATDLATRNQSTDMTKPKASRFTAEQIAAAEISPDTALPNIQKNQAANVPLQVEYWSPQAEGESKRGWILGIEPQEVADIETGELKLLESLLFVEETPDGKKSRLFNASRTLVANVKAAITRGEIVPASILTPVQITYLGVKKNRTNNYKSGKWEILPLVVQG